jgi:hypothetical protein
MVRLLADRYEQLASRLVAIADLIVLLLAKPDHDPPRAVLDPVAAEGVCRLPLGGGPTAFPNVVAGRIKSEPRRSGVGGEWPPDTPVVVDGGFNRAGSNPSLAIGSTWTVVAFGPWPLLRPLWSWRSVVQMNPDGRSRGNRKVTCGRPSWAKCGYDHSGKLLPFPGQGPGPKWQANRS